MTAPNPERHRMLAGACLCRTVRYVVTDAFAYAANCHCSDCRRATGSAFKPFAGIAREALHLTQGGEHMLVFGDAAANHDLHCGKCGSLLYSVVRDGKFVHVAMGTLVDTPSIRPTHHIFVGSKAPWHVITDALPQFDGHAGGAGEGAGQAPHAAARISSVTAVPRPAVSK